MYKVCDVTLAAATAKPHRRVCIIYDLFYPPFLQTVAHAQKGLTAHGPQRASKLRSQVSKLRSQVSKLRSQVSKLRSQVIKVAIAS